MCQLTPRYILNSYWLQTMFFSTLKWLHSKISNCIYNEEKIWFVLRLNERPREYRFSSGIWKTINLLLPRNILLLKHTKTYFSTSTLLIPLNKFSLLWRTILCGITNGFLMVFSAEDVTRGNGLSSYISPIKRLMIQYNLMTVMLPDTSKAQNDITL